MRISQPKDFVAGVMFILFGVAAMGFSSFVRIGTAAKMGPGYFPFALGVVLSLLGVVILARCVFWAKGSQPRPALQGKPVVLVLSSVVVFSLVLRPLGLLLSTVMLVVIASMASHEFRWKESLLNAAVLVVIVVTVFVFFLDSQLPVWPAFLIGRL
ncbi:MAG: tripartite tricarboxylate transporter TctB family protein [Desulfobacterota bacterium]|jgi:hypothetical protein|nr:tripartite tricarboxylate transporter TctB family protein [Thermodesulfobacteriota bacterium]